MTLKGIAASGGIGIGKAVCLKKQGLDFSAVEYAGKEAEKSRLTEALHTFEEKTQAMADAMKAQVGEEGHGSIHRRTDEENDRGGKDRAAEPASHRRDHYWPSKEQRRGQKRT